ncbi:MAG TPA: hypothetical protein VFA09_27115 [Ktedonobacteraceae bacterium]|nr:hypothetical protein [Ktedonobacteraceae bacterium]
MLKTRAKTLIQRHFKYLLALIAVSCLLVVTTTAVLADTVTINDQAGVLDQNKVRSQAQQLPYPVSIYTVNNFTGTSSDFDQRTKSHITNSRLIVIAIDTVHHHLTIVGGSSVPLSNSQYNEAVNAFRSNYSSGGYTGATIAALNSLQSALGSSNASSSGSGFGLSGFGWVCCIGLLILAALALFGGIIGRRRGFFGGRRFGTPLNTPYQQPYNPGYPPNYYGPGYPQGQGMNPWAAGGLGAAAGGLVGYELGKERGEEEARESQNQGDWNNGGNDFGGGASGDFGGGNDFGGGASGDFGGGGGGGGDFGGGSSGNF